MTMNNNQDMTGFGFNPFFPGQNVFQSIRTLENRVSNLEREVNRLNNRVNRLENSFQVPRPRNENPYTSSYETQGYNMM